MSRKSIKIFVAVVALALVFAAIMITVDNDGRRWLKFAVYAGWIVASYLLMFVPGAARCGWSIFRRQPKS